MQFLLCVSYQQIPGFFDFEDVYDLAVASAPRSAVFVEVGAWLGKSTDYLARRIKDSAKQISFFTVDTFEGTPGCPTDQTALTQFGGNVYHAFCQNLEFLGVRDVVTAIQSDSVIAAGRFDAESIDFVFLDGGHAYEQVRADLLAWLPKVKLGGIVAGHDYDFPGVRRAVAELLPPVRRIGRSSWM